MFWFGLFQFINAAGGRFWRNGDKVKIPEDITRRLALNLVEISWYSTATGGDIEQRNVEALGSTLLAFGDDKLEEELRRKARAMRVKWVTQFMDETLRVVARYRKSKVLDRDGGTMLTKRFDDAVQYALYVHAGQLRKGTQIPYVSHVFAVSGLVLEAAGNEDEAIAGLLHDAAEDGGGETRLADIGERFGNTVAGIVKECSDSLAEDPKKKAPAEERKRKHLEHLRQGVSKSALLVTAADKLHNARCILADYRVLGEKLWDRFNVGRAATLQYYGLLAELLESGGVPLGGELRRTVDELQTLAKAAQHGRD